MGLRVDLGKLPSRDFHEAHASVCSGHVNRPLFVMVEPGHWINTNQIDDFHYRNGNLTLRLGCGLEVTPECECESGTRPMSPAEFWATAAMSPLAAESST